MPYDRRDVLDRLRRGRELILGHFDAPAADLAKTYAPGKWTVHEQLVHLADCEAVYFWRVARAAAEPGSRVEAFEQDDWAARLDYARRSLAVARAHFVGSRGAIVELVESLSDDRLNGEAVHSENGPMAAIKFASRTANHALRHEAQIVAARSGRPWVNPGPMPD